MQAMVQSLRELSQLKLFALVGTAVLVFAFFIFISLRVTGPAMAPLFSNIPMDEGGAIVAELESKGIPYQLSGNGTQILIPSDMIPRTRMALAELGLPSSGSVVGYEVFDESEALGTSNFVLNVNKLRAMEGELSRTISSFQKVETARVHLVMPKRELFTRDRQEPTASVAIKFRGATNLDKNEIAAIRHLVATAVPGLQPHRITIVDSRGRLLAKGVSDDDATGVLVEEAESFRVNYENRMRDTIERLLEQSLGYGKVKAEVNAEIDFDRIVKNSEIFDPEGQVARSVQGVEENEVTQERNVNENVSVQNNLPDTNPDNAGTTSQSQLNRSEETTNFEISKEVTNQIKETGTVKRLSVAVLVDGTYAAAEEGGVSEYQPRSDEELGQIEDLVRSAVGFDADRGDDIRVVNMRFAGNEDMTMADGPIDFIKDKLDGIIQTLVLGGVAALAILLVIRPLVTRAIEAAELAREEEEIELQALAGPSLSARLADLSEDEEETDMINIDRIKGKVRSSSYRKINELIDKNPDETLTVLRQWSFADNSQD
jgi:flagellar M-ring protein FliF